MPLTLLVAAALGLGPGYLLARSIGLGSTFGGAGFLSVAWTIGIAGYTLVADQTIKAFGISLWGGWLAPVAILVAICLTVRQWDSKRANSSTTQVASRAIVDISRAQTFAAITFALIVVAQVVPVRTGADIYWGVAELDWRSRLPTLVAIARDGLPAQNPFFNPGGSAKLFFYYGFFLAPATVVRLLDFEPVTVLLVFTGVTAFVTATFAQMLGNVFTGRREGGWVATALLFVTGIDIVPALIFFVRGTPIETIEWWNPGQVTALATFPAWVPHHTLASLEALATLFVWWHADRSRDWRSLTVVSIALLLAGAALTSTYVALGAFATCGGVLLRNRFRDGVETKALIRPAAAILLGGIAAIPFYVALSKLDQYGGPSLRLALRPVPFEDVAMQAFAGTLSDGATRFILRAVLLLPVYFVEFGFFWLVIRSWPTAALRRGEAGTLARAIEVAVITAFVIGSTVESVRTWVSDLSIRIFHASQIALAGVGAAYVLEFRAGKPSWEARLALSIFLLLGVIGTAYELTISRAAVVWAQDPSSPWSAVGMRGAPRFDSRSRRVARWMWENIDRNARVQFDVAGGNTTWMHWLRQPVAISDTDLNALVYGADVEKVHLVGGEMKLAFQRRTPADARRRIFGRYRIKYVLIEEESEIFSIPVEEAFGTGAREVQRWPDCVIVALRPLVSDP